jgi:hypothetical protein
VVATTRGAALRRLRHGLWHRSSPGRLADPSRASADSRQEPWLGGGHDQGRGVVAPRPRAVAQEQPRPSRRPLSRRRR